MHALVYYKNIHDLIFAYNPLYTLAYCRLHTFIICNYFTKQFTFEISSCLLRIIIQLSAFSKILIMYTLEKSINLVTGASPINNNLALLDVDENICADSLAVVNGGYINVIPILNPIRRSKYVSITTGEKRGKEQITEVS